MKNNVTNTTPLFEPFEGGCRISYHDKWNKTLYLGPGYENAQDGNIICDLDGDGDHGADFVLTLFKSGGQRFDYDALRDVCCSVHKCFSMNWTNHYVIRSQNTTTLAIFFGGYLGVSGKVYDTSEILNRMERLNFPLKFDMEKFESVLMHFFYDLDYDRKRDPLEQVCFNTLKPVAQKGKD